MINVKYQSALITGGTRGIGRGIAFKLAESGVKKFALNYIENDTAAKDTEAKLKDRGAEVTLIKADITKPDEVKRMFGVVKQAFGTLGVFVHNARPSPSLFLMPPAQQTPEAMRIAFDSQAVALTVGAQQCESLMASGGRIVAVTYGMGSRTGSFQAWVAMGGAKAALESTVRYFAVAYSKKNITVNAISPGWIEDSVLNSLPEAVYQGVRGWQEKRWTPMGRLGTPADCGNSVALLCAEEASFITGQTLYVDGGASIMSSDLPLEIAGVQ